LIERKVGMDTKDGRKRNRGGSFGRGWIRIRGKKILVREPRFIEDGILGNVEYTSG
jgi:hypothetical protein